MTDQRRADREAQEKRDELFSVALSSNTRAMTNVAKGQERVAVATEKQASEAEARNGHLAEISQQGTKEIIEHLTQHEKVVAQVLLADNTKKAEAVEKVRTTLKDK